MKRYTIIMAATVFASLLFASCGSQSYTCSDPLGCIEAQSGESIKIAALLTLSGPDAPYGVDALRGVEIAIADRGNSLLGHSIELIQQDDLCTEQGGIDGANALAPNADIAGVIGATCSSGSLPAAEILTTANIVLISPSSTAPSLTNPAIHQAGFFRTIYNDKAQGKAVAEFARNVLGSKTMATIHDGTPYPKELQQTACENFAQLGGQCVAQIEIQSGQDVKAATDRVMTLFPDVLYYPVYTVDGVGITNEIARVSQKNIALISSDGLLSSDFLQQTFDTSEGMYFSGPAPTTESQAFADQYLARYNEQPIASYHLQAYDAANLLFKAIEKVAGQNENTLYIPRQALRDAIYATRGMVGLSGVITCSPSGDCSAPDIKIFQALNGKFIPIFP